MTLQETEIEKEKNMLISKIPSNRQKLFFIKHLKFATGDMIALAAALHMYPNIVIVLEKYRLSEDFYKKRKDQVCSFYDENGFKFTEKGKIPTDLKSEEILTRCGFFPKQILGFVHREGLDAEQIANYLLNNVDQPALNMESVTNIIANATQQDLAIVREKWQWRSHGPFDQRLLPIGSNPIFLWSRFSGINGGAHIEYDSSYLFLWSLYKELKKEGYHPMIVGDHHKDTNHGPKTLNILAEDGYNNVTKLTNQLLRSRTEQDYDNGTALFEFWKSSSMSRIEQFKYLDYLSRIPYKQHNWKPPLHIGFRSGNLEAMAIMGHRVLYLECEDPESYGDYGSGRMQQWNNSENICYKRVELTRPISLDSRILRFNNKGKDDPLKHARLGTSAELHYAGSIDMKEYAYASHQNVTVHDIKMIVKQAKEIFIKSW